MFIRKKKLLELIDMHISSAEYVKQILKESSVTGAFEGSFDDAYVDGIIAGLDRLKREFTH